MEAVTLMDNLIMRARAAQNRFADFTQEQVDACVKVIGKVVYDHAEALARLAVEETRMGVYEDKIEKNKGKAKATWNGLKGRKSRGIIRYLNDEGLVEIAKPMGVVGAVTPTTNPVITPMHNAMVALKAGNAIIICPHPRAKQTGVETVNLMRRELKKLGAPEDLIQIIPEPTVELSGSVMKMADVCISTGGPGMIKAAYSSGRPAYGVGAGNVQCLIDRDADIIDAVPKIIRGRTYDNGILCTCEQSVHCPIEMYDGIIGEFVKGGAYHVTGEEVSMLRKAAFPEGVINKDFVGANPVFIAEQSGFTVPEGTKLLIVKLDHYGEDEDLSKEKMFPVLAAFVYDTWEQAVDVAAANLIREGQGHSCVIHSNSAEHIEYASQRLPVSRIAVNQVGSSSLGGALNNGLNPTATLGCGSWGNNSISENLWFHHLMNVSRIAYAVNDRQVPTDEEIWA